MEGEEKKEDIPVEVVYDVLRTAAILAFFENEFGEMPHPFRIFKFKRWVDDFEVFLKGVAFGEKLAREMNSQVVRKLERRIIEEMERND
ncbi:MAG: hypothetical protein J7J46_09890 [Candidatus Desulfofervidus sp.]|nr:hypothetical protein [Candidatus Desulfofervidus sp.]